MQFVQRDPSTKKQIRQAWCQYMKTQPFELPIETNFNGMMLTVIGSGPEQDQTLTSAMRMQCSTS